MAYACMDLRELALPGGFLLLLLSAAAQLPFFIFLCNYLDGDTSIGMKVCVPLTADALAGQHEHMLTLWQDILLARSLLGLGYSLRADWTSALLPAACVCRRSFCPRLPAGQQCGCLASSSATACARRSSSARAWRPTGRCGPRTRTLRVS